MINQSIAIGIGLSPIWNIDTDIGLPGGARILQEDSGGNAILMESGDYILQQ